uniref:CSON006752 protein n=1 Tax=Culicoides sonorensis TaxID=179676 RepID=A0A336KC17_CULSO
MLNCIRRRTEESLHSKRMTRKAEQVHKEFEKAVKVLLLGTGESGKTTILKQMKILHSEQAFSDEDRKNKVAEIRYNLHESIYELVRHVPILGLNFDSAENRIKADYILGIGKYPPQVFDDVYCNCVLDLWINDSSIRTAYNHSNEFQLIDNAKYFLDKVETITRADYIPTNEDILKSRKITNGINEVTFKIKMTKGMNTGIQTFKMFDVGGQRNNRNKWLQVFEGIDAVLFVISCGDFDQYLREDPRQNRLKESLELFERVWNNRFLLQAGVICFLNKQDVLMSKIAAGKHINQYFPEYDKFHMSPAEGNIFDEAMRTRCFIRKQLVDIASEPPKRLSQLSYGNQRERQAYFHYTVATDTENVKKVFNDVHDMIVSRNLFELGLL